MKPDNYMSFGIVSGFFIGLAFSIVKFEDPAFMVHHHDWNLPHHRRIYRAVFLVFGL